jgi:hypothetical protein
MKVKDRTITKESRASIPLEYANDAAFEADITPQNRMSYYNTTDHKMRLYANDAWTDLGGGGTGSSSSINTGLMSGRLTLASNDPEAIEDQADKSTLYFAPHLGDIIKLYNGASWDSHQFSQLSLDLSTLDSSSVYDIYIYDNLGALTLDPVKWTNTSTRSIALANQSGLYVKTGSLSYLYIGTIYIDSSGDCQDTKQERFVWNMYNRIRKDAIYIRTSTVTPPFDLGTNTYTYYANSTNSRVSVVDGISTIKDIEAIAFGQTDSHNIHFSVGIGNTSPVAQIKKDGDGTNGSSPMPYCRYIGTKQAGHKIYYWLACQPTYTEPASCRNGCISMVHYC